MATRPAVGEDMPLCRVEPSVEPADAIVGEQIAYSLKVLAQAEVELEWIEPLLFPEFRADWLPPRPHSKGDVREERRALFPLLAGTLEIPSALMLCRSADGARAEPVRVPPLRVRAREAPALGEPEDYSGLVGPAVVRVRVDRRQIALGESITASVLLSGAGNLWDAAEPWPEAALPGVDVFRKPIELRVDPGARLAVRVAHRLELVPRAAGRLVLPAVRVPYFDARSARYAVAQSEAIEIEVAPRAP